MEGQPKDERDQKTWAVFELTYQGEKAAAEGELEKYLKTTFGATSSQIFVPYRSYICDGRKTLFNVMEGYCFVEYFLDTRDYLSSVFGSPFLKSVLHSRTGYQQILHTVPNSKIEELREKLRNMAVSTLSIGDQVIISKGIYEGISGEVLSLTDKEACVHIKLRSLEAIRNIPRFALTPIGEENE